MNNNQPAANPDHEWTAGVVAIIGRRKDTGLVGPVGTGFVVSDKGLIVTCAHVIDLTEWPPDEWEKPIPVRFNETNATADAVVLESCLLRDLDMAILRLVDGLPERVKALPLMNTEGTKGHVTYVWGFPGGHLKGLLGEGKVLGIEGRDRLQVTSTQTTHGYSGSPVWDEDRGRVIGMITSGSVKDSRDRLQYESFALPAETMVAACGDHLLLTPLGVDEGVEMEGFDNRLLYKAMREHVGNEDLADVALELGIELDDLPGGPRTAKIRELVLHCERRERIPRLLAALEEFVPINRGWYAAAGVTKR